MKTCRNRSKRTGRFVKRASKSTVKSCFTGGKHKGSRAPQKTVLITGNTFAVKEQIKALGGRWDPRARGWRVPASRADKAWALVGGEHQASAVPRKYQPRSRPRGRWTGCSCGSREDEWGNLIPRENNCASCDFDEYDN